MKKLLLTGLLLCTLVIPIKQSHAVIGFMSFPVMTNVAWTGLGIAIGSVAVGVIGEKTGVLNPSNSGWTAVLSVVGFIIMNAETNTIEVEFPDMSYDELLRLGLNSAEAAAYQSYHEELSSVWFDAMTTNPKTDEAANVWGIAKKIYGKDALVGLDKVLKNLF